MSVSESIGPLVYPHRDCAKAKHRSPSAGAKPTGHSFKPMIACCRGWPRLSYWAWVVGPACGSVPSLGGLPMPSLGGLPVGGKHSAASQNCLAYGKGRVRPKCQHLPPCRGWPRLSYWAWVLPWQALTVGLGKRPTYRQRYAWHAARSAFGCRAGQCCR